jgi:hypothetical protein
MAMNAAVGYPETFDEAGFIIARRFDRERRVSGGPG